MGRPYNDPEYCDNYRECRPRLYRPRLYNDPEWRLTLSRMPSVGYSLMRAEKSAASQAARARSLIR